MCWYVYVVGVFIISYCHIVQEMIILFLPNPKIELLQIPNFLFRNDSSSYRLCLWRFALLEVNRRCSVTLFLGETPVSSLRLRAEFDVRDKLLIRTLY